MHFHSGRCIWKCRLEMTAILSRPQCVKALFICHCISAHYNEVIMGSMASQITSLTIVYSLSRLFGRRSKKTSKLRVTGLCAGNSPVPGEFPAQMASNAENVSIWWRHHELMLLRLGVAVVQSWDAHVIFVSFSVSNIIPIGTYR